jgi:predicted dienelactone hydrolase
LNKEAALAAFSFKPAPVRVATLAAMLHLIFLRSLAAVLAAVAVSAEAGVGMAELPANAVSGPVTVAYPTQAAPVAVRRGVFQLDVALDAAPAAANSRLIVISHGSPGSPWVHFDLVRSLVDAGFTVALPEHQGDNYKDASDPGPGAWRRRPAEVSRAIDRLAQEPAFASKLDFSRVGMFGMSAGGHTALTLAGGRWSPSRLRDHCRMNIAEDFHACAGPSVALTGGVLDGVKKQVVQAINDRKFDDPSWYAHADGRIIAVVAGVPFAADFDPDSLRQPKVALALISARKDRWLVPRFHSDAIVAACRSCEHLLNLESGGHGALLGPLPPAGGLSELVQDPPGFDRGVEVPRINTAVTRFFQKTLAQPMSPAR